MSATGMAAMSVQPFEGLNGVFTLDGLQKVRKPKTAKYIWTDEVGQGRNVFGYFRKEFELSEPVLSAKIQIFADTFYNLFVNGVFVEFGPVRFDPRFPLFDLIDIAKYLNTGKNVIAVKVNHFGCKTYKSMDAAAGMVAWGEVKTKGKTLLLDTNSKSWKCLNPKSYQEYSPKMSFALNPADLYFQEKNEDRWIHLDYNSAEWKLALELKNQNIWGIPLERNIPYMSKNIVPLKSLVKVQAIKNDFETVSFRVPLPSFFEGQFDYAKVFPFSTFIHSPNDQEVIVGVFWAEAWLNGQELEKGVLSVDKSMLLYQRWSLKKGWNYYFAKVGPYMDVVDQYFLIPKDCQIKFSADKNLESKYIFRHCPAITQGAFIKILSSKTLPYQEDDNLSEVGGWVYISSEVPSQSPCRETCYDTLLDPFVQLDSMDELFQYTFKKSEYPEGFSILMRMDHIHLAFPYLKISGVEGATVDITSSEYMSQDDSHLHHLFNYQCGDRVVCSLNELEYIPTHPKGIHHFKLTVRNTQNDIKIEKLHLIMANYPSVQVGEFKCSNGLFNEIWQLCLRTQITNMEDVYVDCVGRERGMYLRDAMIQYYNSLVAFTDHKLAHRCIQLYGQSPDITGKFRAVYPNDGTYTISDFALDMLEFYDVYYQNSGDLERVRADWNAIVNNLAWFDTLSNEREDKLLDADWPKRSTVQAHYGGFHGDLSIVEGHFDDTGIHCAFSTTYYLALKHAMKLASILGKQDDFVRFKQRAEILGKSIHEKFWNNDLQRFADNFSRKTHSIQANLLVLRAEIASPEQTKYIHKYLKEILGSLFVNGYDPTDGNYSSPAYAFYVLDSLYKTGLPEIAEKLISDGWGWVINQDLKTCPEYWTKDTSLCHAWSASPMYHLSKNILGIHFPKAPDLSLAQIKINTKSVSWAEGKFPHPKGGVIEVKWHTEGDKRVFDYVKAPEGVKIEFVS